MVVDSPLVGKYNVMNVLASFAIDRPVSVSFAAGVLTDPNDDLNPATTVDVTAPR